jgi:hypothetical protein
LFNQIFKMSDSNFNQQQKEGQEGQKGPEDPEYVIVCVDGVSNPPPSNAVATAPPSLWSAMMSAIAALRPNVDSLVVAVAAGNRLSDLSNVIMSCSTSASRFFQHTVATPENLNAVRGAIGFGAIVMKTAASHLGSALSSSASAMGSLILPISQDFDTSSRVVNIKGIRFVQVGPKILWVRFDNGTVCGYRFPVKNLDRIEMFCLTSAICLFLLHTTDGRVFASVYTTQYGRDITCLNRVTQIGEDGRFKFFETSDVCIHGTVGLTVFYNDRSQRFFRVERDGAIHPILLICDSQDDKSK